MLQKERKEKNKWAGMRKQEQISGLFSAGCAVLCRAEGCDWCSLLSPVPFHKCWVPQVTTKNSEKQQVCVINTAGEGWEEQRERSNPRQGSERGWLLFSFPLGMQI